MQQAGLARISHFAELVGIGRSTATGVIDRLEEAAPVERMLDRNDRRVVKVRATTRGTAALRDCAPLSDGTIGGRIKALSVDQQGQLADLLDLVIAAD